ncbi:unnamed protein product [Rhodiola kirilowii]
MVDSKTVTSQVQDLQDIMHEMNSEGMKVNEPFQVAAVIEKLPSGWKDFKNYLKHKRKEMSMEDLVIRLKNEEKRFSDKRMRLPSERANIMEHGGSSKGKKSFSKLGLRSGAIKKKVQSKFTGRYSIVTKRVIELLTVRSKDEAIEKFAMYKLEVENQLNKKIKRLRSDRGGEYSEPFGALCAQTGIIHEVTPPYSPESNGIAERKNRTIKEMMNAILHSSGLPQEMWGEAVLSANYLLNRIPRKKKEKSPYELFKGRKPSYTHLPVWGCLAKVMAPGPKRMKIAPKTIDCVFIGYARNSTDELYLYDSSNQLIPFISTLYYANSYFLVLFCISGVLEALGGNTHKRWLFMPKTPKWQIRPLELRRSAGIEPLIRKIRATCRCIDNSILYNSLVQPRASEVV